MFYPYWVFECLDHFFVKVAELLVDVSRCKGPDDVYWTQKLYMNFTCFDRHWLIIWSDERQLKHNLFFLSNSLWSSTRVAFNTVQSQSLWLPLQNQHLNFSSLTWGLSALTENCWHLNDGFYYHALTYLIYHPDCLNLWTLLCFL